MKATSESDATASTFIVRCANQNRWVVSTSDDSTGGIFRSVDDAWRFARAEARSHKHGEVVVLGDRSVDIEEFDDSRKVSARHVDGAIPEAIAGGRK